MKKEIGLWVDHREAVIVILSDGVEETRYISSNSGNRVRYFGGSHSKNPQRLKGIPAEDQKDRKFTNTLNKYYDEIIAVIRDAETIQIFGPGEAKGELEKRIEREGLRAHILVIETMDKMTDRQILAKVRERFPVKNEL